MNEHCICCSEEIDMVEAIHNEGVCTECLVYGPETSENFSLELVEKSE